MVSPYKPTFFRKMAPLLPTPFSRCSFSAPKATAYSVVLNTQNCEKNQGTGERISLGDQNKKSVKPSGRLSRQSSFLRVRVLNIAYTPVVFDTTTRTMMNRDSTWSVPCTLSRSRVHPSVRPSVRASRNDSGNLCTSHTGERERLWYTCRYRDATGRNGMGRMEQDGTLRCVDHRDGRSSPELRLIEARRRSPEKTIARSDLSAPAAKCFLLKEGRDFAEEYERDATHDIVPRLILPSITLSRVRECTITLLT